MWVFLVLVGVCATACSDADGEASEPGKTAFDCDPGAVESEVAFSTTGRIGHLSCIDPTCFLHQGWAHQFTVWSDCRWEAYTIFQGDGPWMDVWQGTLTTTQATAVDEWLKHVDWPTARKDGLNTEDGYYAQHSVHFGGKDYDCVMCSPAYWEAYSGLFSMMDELRETGAPAVAHMRVVAVPAESPSGSDDLVVSDDQFADLPIDSWIVDEAYPSEGWSALDGALVDPPSEAILLDLKDAFNARETEDGILRGSGTIYVERDDGDLHLYIRTLPTSSPRLFPEI
jgi:hypothetical protein